MNVAEYNRHHEAEAFEAYMQNKRANFAPSFGATIVSSVVLLGVEVPQPNTEYREKAVTNEYSYSRDLGSTAHATEMLTTNELNIDYNDPRLIYGRAEDYALAR